MPDRLDEIKRGAAHALEYCYPGDNTALHRIAREDIPWLIKQLEAVNAYVAELDKGATARSCSDAKTWKAANLALHEAKKAWLAAKE